VLELTLTGTGWKEIRLALSLALMKGTEIILRNGAGVVEGDFSLPPLYEDIKRLVFETGCGMIAGSGADMVFYPEKLHPGRYSIDTGSCSSITELELFMLPSLFHADSRSVINFRGVTHSHLSYPTVFLKETLFGLLEQCGFYAGINMKRFGYYGSGGGIAESRIYPAEERPCEGLLSPREVTLEGVRIFVARLEMSLAEREKEFVLKNMEVPPGRIQIMDIRDADGYGNSIQAYMKYGNVNVILSRDMEIYNSAGDLVFDEGRYYSGLSSLRDEAVGFIKTGRLPLDTAAELIPYMIMTGTPVPEEYRGAWSYSICEEIL